MPTNKTMTLGDNVRAARVALQLTQIDLARAIGHKGEDAGAYISHIESGKTEPRISTLQRIATVLKVPMDSLIAK